MDISILTFFLVLLSLHDASCALRSKRGIPVVEKCPINWNHPKCSCETSTLTGMSTVQCRDITDSAEIKSAFAQDWADGNKNFEWFTLENAQLTSFPDDVLRNFAIIGLIVTNSTILNISDKALQGMGSRVTGQYIWATNSNFTGFNFKALQVLKKLTSVSLTNCNINDVPDNAFKGFELMERINLENNRISHLGINSFSSLPQLRFLDLSGNSLTELKSGQLSMKAVLKPIEIDLSNNNIETIEADSFSDFAQPPFDLDLSSNKLHTLKEEIFAPLLARMKDLSWPVLRVTGNSFTCDASMDWLLQRPNKYRKIVKGLQCSDGRRPFENENQ